MLLSIKVDIINFILVVIILMCIFVIIWSSIFSVVGHWWHLWTTNRRNEKLRLPLREEEALVEQPDRDIHTVLWAGWGHGSVISCIYTHRRPSDTHAHTPWQTHTHTHTHTSHLHTSTVTLPPTLWKAGLLFESVNFFVRDLC